MKPDPTEGQLRIVVSGALGRMGRTVTQLALADPSLEIVGGIDRDAEGMAGEPETGGARPYPIISTIADAAPLLARADVVIDFSAPVFLRSLLERHLANAGGGALVVGTTGLGAEEEALLDRAARGFPVLTAANFSIGVNLLLALVERSAAALGQEFDVEIVEAHHRRKEDAPSGTALALGQAVATGRSVDLESARRDGRSGRPGPRPTGEIGFHAIRGGEVIGDHSVHFIGDTERIELAHRASDRSLFAAGALRAAKWLGGRPAGRYTMRQMLGF